MRFVESDDDVAGEELASEEKSASRPRAEIASDLQRETGSLLAALAAPTTAVAKYSIPRTVRIGSKAIGKGVRFAARRYGR